MDEFKGMVFLQIFKWHWISVKYLTNDNIKFLYNMKQTPRNWQCQLVIYISWNHDQYFFKICIVSHSHSRIRRQHPLSISLYLNQKQKRGKWGGGGCQSFFNSLSSVVPAVLHTVKKPYIVSPCVSNSLFFSCVSNSADLLYSEELMFGIWRYLL